jgi:hypothetical protein
VQYIYPGSRCAEDKLVNKWTVIVVHGVGNAAPGSILEESSKGMPGLVGLRSDVVVNGQLFPTLDVANHPRSSGSSR